MFFSSLLRAFPFISNPTINHKTNNNNNKTLALFFGSGVQSANNKNNSWIYVIFLANPKGASLKKENFCSTNVLFGILRRT